MKVALEDIKVRIVKDLYTDRDRTINVILKAYNVYQEETSEDVDYILNLHDKDDLLACVDGGITAEKLADLVINEGNKTPYFFFGVNYKVPKQFDNFDQLFRQLISWLDDILPRVLAYPNAFDSFKEVYRRYFTPYFEDVLF